MCVYIYVYVCIHVHTYIHPYIHTYIHTYIPAYLPTCIHTYIHTYIHTIHAYIHLARCRSAAPEVAPRRGQGSSPLGPASARGHVVSLAAGPCQCHKTSVLSLASARLQRCSSAQKPQFPQRLKNCLSLTVRARSCPLQCGLGVRPPCLITRRLLFQVCVSKGRKVPKRPVCPAKEAQ